MWIPQRLFRVIYLDHKTIFLYLSWIDNYFLAESTHFDTNQFTIWHVQCLYYNVWTQLRHKEATFEYV